MPALYDVLLFAINKMMPVWKEYEQIVQNVNPSIVIMPSLCSDSFTMDMIETSKKKKVKSLVLINSWDNLVSKGVIPMPPDFIGVWGEQGVKQAVEIQNVPRQRVIIMGAPRFEMYFNNKPQNAKKEIYEFNGINEDMEIVLFAATVMPFDDCGALKILDNEIKSKEAYGNYRILYRPHPEMLRRVGETHISEYNLEKVLLDKQMEEFYNLRFAQKEFPSYINKTSLDYYPKLLSSVKAVVSAPTTLSLEAALNGIPVLMICYNDGKNFHLTPEQVSQYENIQEILVFPGIIPCYREADLLNCFKKLVAASQDAKLKQELVKATEYVLYRDKNTYSQRLADLADRITN
jgi:hypothetical protein